MGSNTEKKKLWTNVKYLYKKISKDIKSGNFWYRQVGIATTIWEAIENKKILDFEFWGNNSIFVDFSNKIS